MKFLVIKDDSYEVVFPGDTGVINIENNVSAKKLQAVLEKEEKIFYIQSNFSENKGIIIEPEQIIEVEKKAIRMVFTAIGFAKVNDINDKTEQIEEEIAASSIDESVLPSANVELMEYETADEMDLLVKIGMLRKMFNKFEKALHTHLTVLPTNPIKCLLAIAKEVISHDKFNGKEFYNLNNLNDLAFRLNIYVAKHLEMSEIDERVNEKVKEAMETNQKEYYIREQIKALKEEIGEDEDNEKYIEALEALTIAEKIKEKFIEDVQKLDRMSESSPDSAQLKNYLDFVIALPWNKYDKENTDLTKAEKTLEADHYGIKEVKERLIEALAVRKLTAGAKSPIICLVGAPGIGKTSIAKSIAKAMNRKYERISLGGINDEAEIRGHRKTYIGAMPGRILNAVKASGTANPLILLDELDKMSSTYKGDPSSAMLEVLDPEQNVNFRDHYLEVPFDLSKVLFIATANTLNSVPRPLLDRMEIIEMSGYTDLEKLEIAKRYLIKKAQLECGLKGIKIKIDDSAILDIIHNYTRESGVRGLEKTINKIMRKIARNHCIDAIKSAKVTSSSLIEYLEEPKYPETKINKKDKVGVVNGLAWTEVGGEMLSIEVNTMKGKGEMILTGNLGDVMKESCKIAFSYMRSIADNLNINDTFFKENDTHIHVPEGATPKDGPSAGITIATTLFSALTKKAVPYDVAMTGELSLMGNVLPIGGLKEKSLAALRNGIRKIYVSEQNETDVNKLPSEVKEQINFIKVTHIDEIFKGVFGYGN